MTNPYLNLGGDEEEENPYLNLGQQFGIGNYLSNTVAPESTQIPSIPQTPRRPAAPMSGMTRREGLPDYRPLVQGIGEGAKNTGQRLLANLTRAGMRVNDPEQAIAFDEGTTRQLRPVATPQLPEATDPLQSAGRFAGGLAAELPLSMLTSGMINPVTRGTATKLLGSAATKVAQKVASSTAMQEAVAVGITTIPQEIIAGSITEALVRPESFATWQGALRTGILSSVGSIFNTGFAYRNALKNATTPAEVIAIKEQIDNIVPTTTENPPLYSAVELANARQGPLQQGGQLPTAREAAWRRIEKTLNDQAELKLAQLSGPQPEVDVLSEASLVGDANRNNLLERLRGKKKLSKADRREMNAIGLDPIILAAMKGMDDRLKQTLEVLGGGKGVQTPTTPDLGVTLPPPLTLDELNDYLRTLNMASISAEPQFKKGQRFIIPRTQIPTAEEIAGMATGGPIKRIDPAIQKQMKDVQRRLDEAAATRNGTLDPEETADIVNEMLSMSQRLARGFEVPRTTPPRPVGPASETASRNVEGWDLPVLTKISEPNFAASASDDTYKRWVTGSDAPDAPPVVPEAAQTVATTYADAVRNSNISYEPQKTGIFTKISDSLKNFRGEFINRAEFVGRYNKPAQDILESLSGISTYADEFYNNQMRIATRDTDGNVTQQVVQGRPLGQVVRNLSDDQIKEVDSYLKARTSLEQKAIDPTFKLDRPSEEFQLIVDNAPDYVKNVGAEFKIISDALVDDAVAMGRLSSASSDRMKSKFYAGLSRVFNNNTTQQSLLRRTGSLRESQSPLRLMRDNIYTMLNKSRRNYAFSRLLEDYKKEPIKYNGVMEPIDVKDGLYGIEGYRELVKEFQEQGGLPVRDAEDLAGLMAPSLDKTDGTLVIYDQGKPTFWRINPDLKHGIDAFNPLEMGVFKALMSGISRPTRMGVSAALDLSGIGPVSDMILTTARVPEFTPIVDSLRGLFHSAIKSDMYQERIAALGGYGSQFLKGEDVIPLGKGAEFVRRGGEIVSSPFAMLQAIVRPLSDASRMGEYLVRRQKLGQDAMSSALGSRRTLGDFNRVGAQMRGWSLITEFGNVGIQSADAAAQLAKDVVKAAKAGDMKPLTRAAATFAGAITAPTIYFWAASQGDKEIEALRKSKNGYRYWWMRAPYDLGDNVKEGEIVKVPKLGWWAGQMFGSSVEMMLDGMDAEAGKRFADGILSQVGINTLPLSLTKLAGLATDTRNLDWSMALGLTDRIPITPRGQEGLMPIVQGNERTTPVGELAAQARINPYKADYVLEMAGGSLFSSIVRSLSDRPVQLEKSDIPIFGRYFVSSKSPTEGSEMFYKDLKEAQEADKSFRKAAEFGKAAEAESILEENQRVIALRKPLEAVSAQISEMNSLMLTIINDDTISPEGKRQYLDNIRKQQQEIFAAYATARKQMVQ
jgi:hypothetical protein